MARTKQTIRRGRVLKPPAGKAFFADTFQDHAQRPYTVVGGPSHSGNPNCIRKLSIHLYFLSDVDAEQRAEMGYSLLRSKGITSWGKASNYWPRVDVYAPLDNIEECMEHHRREKMYRQQAVEELHATVAADARDQCDPGMDDDDREEAARKQFWR